MSWGEYIRQKSLKKMLWGREYDNIDARMSFVVDAVQQDIDAVHNPLSFFNPPIFKLCFRTTYCPDVDSI